ncbi:hypothetical protein BEL04_18820 [Mucilaginibacter sp. PPCGB 2223]|uniref:hypothetical protein n=1 Tax=Mucilaginibacter sp. PPCGB 2223 TaxID=1886027 RepID=UPI000825E63C|nr:hypothetical protein [Mucilaginibacter sp. PPCGB 2223]OCX50788.1 hypothetical protein BEL04_18820 [Mucilaginibacter sp. PPCGB 2223]
MRKSFKFTIALALLGVVLWGCSRKPAPSAGTVSKVVLPPDVCKSCVVAKDTFNHWFKSGTPAPNGQVLPANSVTFVPNNNCDFYRWSEQMFLWITSPDSTYSPGGGIVLESPVFYNVSPPNPVTHERTLSAHKPDSLLRMTGHIRKLGPHRLPAFMDKNGRLFEIEEAAKPVVKDATGKSVEVGQINPNANGPAQLLDKAGKPIAHPAALLQHKTGAKFIVQRVKVGKNFVFLDSSGKQVQAEQAQATDDILMSQGKSLVYYLTLVNDVYAYYVTAVRNKSPMVDSTSFPITAAARDSVCKYARKTAHATLPDSNALAIEIKSSWVEASTLPNPQDYVTVNAIIPTYDTSDSTNWKPNGEKKAKMALVGIHIVGSVAHHPEMVWATFEHESNTPNAKYQYIDSTSAKTVKTVPQDKGTGWLFSNTTDTSLSAYNNSHMTDTTATGATTDNIIATPGNTVSPSNTMQTLPWGSAFGQPTNQEDKSSAASNSEVISINNYVRDHIPGADIRKNYLFIGAIWTFGGTGPTGTGYDQTTPGSSLTGVTIGTSVLANTTMETYFQSPQFSCFTCHSDNASFAPDAISHIFRHLEPLYVLHDSLNKAPKKKK